MKPHPSKTNDPKAKSKAAEKAKSGKGKAAGAASGKARAVTESPIPPPMNSRKVAKAPAVALKNLEKKASETEDVAKKVTGKATKRPAAPSAGSSSNVSNAPKAAAAPPNPPKKKVKPVKKPSMTLETIKEEVVTPKADPPAKAEKPKKAPAKVPKPMVNPNPKKPKKLLLRGKGFPSKKKVWQRFVIDCSCLVDDKLMDLADMEKYMKTHIKVNQRINQLGDLVNFDRSQHTALVINSSVHFSKRYFKYLTKRYLKKNVLRDWVRVVSTAKDTFSMRYFMIQDDDSDDEEAKN